MGKMEKKKGMGVRLSLGEGEKEEEGDKGKRWGEKNIIYIIECTLYEIIKVFYTYRLILYALPARKRIYIAHNAIEHARKRMYKETNKADPKYMY